MRLFITVCATAMLTGLAAIVATSPVSSASSESYNSSRGGTRTPDPVINSHLLAPEEKAHQATGGRQNTTEYDNSGLVPATVSATADTRRDAAKLRRPTALKTVQLPAQRIAHTYWCRSRARAHA